MAIFHIMCYVHPVMVLMLKMCKFDYHKFDSKLKGKECFSKDNFVVIFSHMSALYVYSRCVHKNSLMSMLKFIFCELLEFLRRMSNLVSALRLESRFPLVQYHSLPVFLHHIPQIISNEEFGHFFSTQGKWPNVIFVANISLDFIRFTIILPL